MPILVQRSRLEVGSDNVQFPTVSGFKKNDDHILRVDRRGGILWRTTGSFDEAKGSELATAIETYRKRAELSP